MILFPAIDLREGRAVRLVQGDFEHVTVFNDDPVAQARLFAEQGATHLHVVDLDGALEGVPVHAPVVASIAAAFGGTVHYGGGMRSRAAIETAIATGIDRVVVGTAVLQDAGSAALGHRPTRGPSGGRARRARRQGRHTRVDGHQ